MGFNSSKVILIVVALVIAGLINIFTQKEMIDAVSIKISEVLSHQKIKVAEGKPEVKVKSPTVVQVEKPNLKVSARFTYHYKIHDKSDLVTHAETVTWKIVSLDQTQMTWESEDHLLEAFSRNPFLPPLNASESLFRSTRRLDYLSSPEIFPLSASEPKVVRIQERSTEESAPYDWSCLMTGQENLKTMGGEFPVEVITCVVTGGKFGTETFKYSKEHGHWIARERNGFNQPRLTVELVSYTD